MAVRGADGPTIRRFMHAVPGKDIYKIGALQKLFDFAPDKTR